MRTRLDGQKATDLLHPAGWVDSVRSEGGGWRLEGWAFLPDSGLFESNRASWDDVQLESLSRVQRPDLVSYIPWIRDVENAGFAVTISDRDAHGLLTLTGVRGGKPMAALCTTFIAPHLETAPLPPVPLAQRVSDLSGDAFRLSGLKAATDVTEQIRRHVPELTGTRVLDWGCGCGRVSRYLPHLGLTDLCGCDIDAEAVNWCSTHLDGQFSVSMPDPPLPYEDGEIDVVIATSVFTHLTRAQQERWLKELRRVLSKDGLLIASVAGEFAVRVGRPGKTRARLKSGSSLHRLAAHRKLVGLRRVGILDGQPDQHMENIAPTGYYRSVFQSSDYTRRTWTQHFDLVDYVDLGLCGHQDLVVMRQRNEFRTRELRPETRARPERD